MPDLPMAPASCSLDDAALSAQLDRYRLIGSRARMLREAPDRIVIRVDRALNDSVIDELIRTESACCPFFAIDWRPAERQLTISVRDPRHAPDLHLIRACMSS